MIMRSAMHLGATTKVRSLSEKDQRIGCGQGPLYAHCSHRSVFERWAA